jgi:hypothetical protein
MKRILFLVLIIVGSNFGQWAYLKSQVDSKYRQVAQGDTLAQNVYIVGGDTLNTKVSPPSGLISGTKSVTTSASLLATSADAQEVWIINDNENGVIYFGDSGVTTSNGFPLYPKMSAVIRTDNIADIYVIAASTLTARYLKFN